MRPLFAKFNKKEVREAGSEGELDLAEEGGMEAAGPILVPYGQRRHNCTEDPQSVPPRMRVNPHPHVVWNVKIDAPS